MNAKQRAALEVMDTALAVLAGEAPAYTRSVPSGGTEKTALPDTYEYGTVRETYASALTDAFMGYASSGGRVTSYSNAAKRAVLEAVADAIYRGFDDAGADELESDDERWLTGQQTDQLAFLPDVFAWIKDARDAETISEDAIAARVEMWARTLDGIYAEAKMRGSKSKTLEFSGDDGAESCSDCQRLKGKRHTIKWILANDMIPRPGNKAFACGGWQCAHFWRDPKTNERYTF